MVGLRHAQNTDFVYGITVPGENIPGARLSRAMGSRTLATLKQMRLLRALQFAVEKSRQFTVDTTSSSGHRSHVFYTYLCVFI